jgi:hypothetical protein
MFTNYFLIEYLTRAWALGKSQHAWLAPLICRGGCYFFLDKKVTKKSSQQKGFFSHKAFALQNAMRHGYVPLRRNKIPLW